MWVELRRAGNTFAAFTSTDGTTWTPVTSTTVAMPAAALAGIHVKSANATQAVTGTFAHAAVTPATPTPTPTPTPTAASALTAAAAAGTQVSLAWTDNSSNETGFKVLRSANGGGYATLYTTAANAVSYTDATAAYGTRYGYEVVATNGAGDAAASDAAAVTTVPAAPVGPAAAAASSTAINLGWSAAAGATGYVVQRSPDGTAGWAQVGTPAVASFSDAGLTAGTTYYYRVGATDAGGGSAWSAVAAATTTVAAPAAPAAPTLTVASAAEIDLSWPAVGGATGYVVQRSPDGSTSWAQVGTPAASPFADAGLTAGTAYYYRVGATDAGGASAWSATASATTVPAQPAAPTPAVASATELDLSWAAVTGATGYVVQRSPDGLTSWAQVGTAVAGLSLPDAGLSPSATYYYRLAATDASGTSAWSAVSTGTTGGAPLSPPTAVTATALDDTDAEVDWTPDPSDTGTRFEVDRQNADATWTALATVDDSTDGDTYYDGGLSGATTYAYRVRAVGTTAALDSAYVAASAATPLTTPDAPADLSATEGSPGEVDLTWYDDGAIVTGYVVTATPLGGGGGGAATTFAVAGDAQAFAATGLTDGVPYSFAVAADNDQGNGNDVRSAASGAVVATPSGAVLTATATATVAEGTPFTLTLASYLPGGGLSPITSWRVAWDDGSAADAVTGATGTVDHTPAAGSAQATAIVTATDAAGDTFALPAVPVEVVPSAPTGLTAAPQSPDTIDLAWTPASAVATAYLISVSTDGGATYEPLDQVDGAQTTYAAAGLSAGTAYTFTVAAQAGGPSSPASAPAAATTATPPVVTATGDDAVAEGAAYTLSLASTTGAGSVDGWDVDWGDGTGGTPDVDHYDGGSATATHTFGAGVSASVVTATATVAASGSGPAYAVAADPVPVGVVPLAPTGVTAAAQSAGDVRVSWANASAAADAVVVLRSGDGGATFAPVATLAPDATQYDDAAVSPGTTYGYAVEATGGLDGAATAGPAAGAASSAATPAADLTLSVASVGPGTNQAVLAWHYAGADETGFEVEQEDATAGEDFHAVQLPGPVGGPGDTGTTIAYPLTAGDDYRFRVRADLADGLASGWASGALPASMWDAPTLRAAAGPDGSGAVDLSWAGPAAGAPYGYLLQCRPQGGLLWGGAYAGEYTASYIHTAVGDTSYAFQSPTPGVAYQFRLAVASGGGTPASAWSGVAGATVPTISDPLDGDTPPYQVADPSVTVGLSADGRTVHVSWTPTGHSTDYTQDPAVESPDTYTVRLEEAGSDPAGTTYDYYRGGESPVGTATAADFPVDPVAPGTRFYADVYMSNGSDIEADGSTPYGGRFGVGSASVVIGPPDPARPASPTGLVATLTGADAVSLHWADNSADEDGFDVYRSADPTFATYTDLGTTAADANQYTDTLPDAATTYYYEVYAEKGAGGTPSPGPTPTPTPTTLPTATESINSTNGNSGGLTLRRLSFGGERDTPTDNDHPAIDIQPIARDNGSGDYSAPQWLDQNGDGHITAPGATPYVDGTVDTLAGPDHVYPISYERSLPTEPAYMEIDVTLFAADFVSNFELVGNAASAGFTFRAVHAGLALGYITVDAECIDKIPSTIQSENLEIQWQVSFDGGKTLVPLVTTHNWLFVTGGPAAHAYETVLDLGCEGAKNMHPGDATETPSNKLVDDRKVVDGVWGKFSGRTTYRVDGTLMVYSHLTLHGMINFASNATDMLSGVYRGRGECDAWADLLVLTLEAQGEGAVSCKITPPANYLAFAVKAMPAQGSGGANCPDGTKAAGQHFVFHQVVKVTAYPNLIYDPSYGGNPVQAPTIALAETVYEKTNITDFWHLSGYVPVLLGDPLQLVFTP